MGTLANSGDPDENAIYYVAFHCLLRQNESSENGVVFFLNYNLLSMDHPVLTVLNFMEHSIGHKRGNLILSDDLWTADHL